MSVHPHNAGARVPVALACAVLACVVTSALAASAARAETIRVGQDAATVQAAVDRARVGDVVQVPNGAWKEHVRVDKAITLRGTGGILDGGGTGTVLTVSAPGARIEGLAVRGSGSDLGAPDCCIYTTPEAVGVVVADNRLKDCAFGIWIHKSEGAQVLRNEVIGRSQVRPADRGNGVHLFDADHLVVSHNRVVGTRDGVYVSATDDSLISDNDMTGVRYGVHYMYSYRNVLKNNRSSGNLGGLALMESRGLTVVDNVASDNKRHGLLFRDAQDCVIRGNQLTRNGQGMFFFSSTDNVIEDNLVAHNDIGAKIWAGSRRNRVSGNRFVGNRQQIFYVGSHDLVWGEGDQNGNFWSDYLGWDQDGDGVGEPPYRVDSFASTLMYRYPGAALLMRSPALELLSYLEQSLPLLRVPTVVDRAPLVQMTGRRTQQTAGKP